jgi:hypothetical protein
MRGTQLHLLASVRGLRWWRARLDTLGGLLARAKRREWMLKTLVDGVLPAGGGCAALFLFDRTRNRLGLVDGRGWSRSMMRRMSWLPLDSSLPFAEVVRTGRAIWFRDRPTLLADCPGLVGRVAEQDLHSMVAVPLKEGGKTIGALAIGFGEAQSLSDRELEFLMAAAELAGDALTRLETAPPILFERTHERICVSVSAQQERLDLGRLARTVCRQALPSFQQSGQTLTCETRGQFIGRHNRAWAERVLGGLLTLAQKLVPQSAVALDVRLVDGQVVVHAGCSSTVGERACNRASLAGLTRERDEWLLQFWLWRAIAHERGGRLAILQRRGTPLGLCLSFPT